MARRHGLSYAAHKALGIIEGTGAPIPTGAVSTHLHITTGTRTSVLDTQERNGYIQRLTDPDDRHRVLVDVIPAAHGVLDRLLPEVVLATTAALAGFSTMELEAFLGILARIRNAIDALPADVGSPAPRRTPPNLERS